MSVRLLAAAVVTLAAVGTASAQYPGYGYTYTNPYTGYTTSYGVTVNPNYGSVRGYTAGYNPWTGYGTNTYGYQNAFGGFRNSYSAYNVYTGYGIARTYGYNPWTNYGYNVYRVLPGGFYWR